MLVFSSKVSGKRRLKKNQVSSSESKLRKKKNDEPMAKGHKSQLNELPMAKYE